MKNLKILIFKKAWLSESPKYLPNSLRVLQWPKYPSSCLPINFHPKKLAILDLQNSCLQLLTPIKRLENLSVLDLFCSQFIAQIPDVSGCPNLTKLRLELCENLTEIHNSVGSMEKLQILSAFGCVQLRTFPGCIRLPSLRKLNLQYCISLEKFPKVLQETEHITELDLSQTNLELSCSISNPTGLRELAMDNCQKNAAHDYLIELLRSTQDYKSMYISLAMGNISDELLSMYLTWFPNVKCLELSYNNFTILPACIKECHFLRELYMNDCNHLREIRGIPPNIVVLEAKNCTALSSESRSILLSQKLHEAGDKRFLIQGASIPEWFDICRKGPSISFRFRNNFPMISLCVVVSLPVNRVNFLQTLSPKVIINGKKMSSHGVWNFDARTSILADHIFLPYIPLWDNIPLRSGWNNVEVYMYTRPVLNFVKEDALGVKEIGMKVMKGNRMEDIQFIDPYEKLCKLKLPKKLRIFLWKAHRNVLALKEYIMDDARTCPTCGAVREYIMHTLVACPFAEVIWSMSPLMLRCKSLPQAPFSSWWEGLSSSLSYLQDSMGMLEIAGFICWRIWNCRNEKVFNMGSMQAWQVISLVLQQVNEFQASLQGTRENDSATDFLSLRRPLDEVNKASSLDLPDTTDHQGLRQQHFTSINLQQIPKISENENVRKVKADDVIVYRRKRRRIH